MTAAPISTSLLNINQRLLFLLQTIGGSLFIALCSEVKVPLFFTPVPLTFQTFSVILVGGMLGRKLGSLSVLLYLAETMLGLPFLAGGRVDPLSLFSPVGGYLVGFIFLAYFVGWLMEQKTTFRNHVLFLGILAACILELIFGAAWLSQYVGATNSILMGVLPFIPGDILKGIAAYIVLKNRF